VWQPCEPLYTCYLLTYLHTDVADPIPIVARRAAKTSVSREADFAPNL